MTINVISILWELWDMLLDLATNLYDFLFTPSSFGGLINPPVAPFFAVGGTVIIVLIVAYIVKLVVPFL